MFETTMSSSSSWSTPTKKSLTRVPSLGSSLTSCFGASAPVSPRREGGHYLLAGQAGMNYRKLGFDEEEEEDEDDHEYQDREKSEDEHENVLTDTQSPPLKPGSHSSSKDRAKKGVHCANSEGGDDEFGRQRKCVFKLGKQRTKREKARMGMCSASEILKKGDFCYVSEEEDEDGYARERKDEENVRKGVMQKLGKQYYSMREKSKEEVCYESEERPKKGEYIVSEEEDEENARERKGIRKLGKEGAMGEKAEVGGVHAGSARRGSLTKRASFGARVREACVQVLETVKRSSPHLSELFVGNQLLMQVTSSSSFNARHGKSVVPSAGFLVSAGDPSLSITMSPPPNSTSSAF